MLVLAMVLIMAAFESPAPSGPAPRQLPSVEAMADRLVVGRLVLEQARFRPDDETLTDGADALLRQAARALNRIQGKFVVYVPAELLPRLPADTVLSRRRSAAAYRALLAAGSNPQHLIGPAGAKRTGAEANRLVASGQARIELLRIE